MIGRRKRLIFSIITIFLVLCFIELLSFVFFRVFHERFTFYDVSQYQLDEAEVAQLGERYHPELGWDNFYDTTHGERPRTVTYRMPLVASFGDSYTHCSDVGDGETWQAYLSELLQADIYNFGTPGFGTDQAYLKYLTVRSKLHTDVVILGLITENINRIVNIYRPFYFSDTGLRLPKPRFVLEGGRLELLENPVTGRADIERLCDEPFIHELGRHDYWYNRDNYPVYRFPYTGILFNKRIWLEVFYGKRGQQIHDVNPRPWEDLWQEEEITSLMFGIVDSFVSAAQLDGSVPIILVLPLQDQVFERFVTGRNPQSVSMVLDYCERQDYPCLDTITELAASVGRREEIVDLFIVHLSPKGNRIVANALHRIIEERVLSGGTGSPSRGR
jgi:hypothetical protein